MTRWIELYGAVNVRDVGGLPTSDGGTIRTGSLLRSDNLQGLTAHDVGVLVSRIGLRHSPPHCHADSDRVKSPSAPVAPRGLSKRQR